MIARRNFFQKLLGSLVATTFMPVAAWSEGKPSRKKKPTTNTPSPTLAAEPAGKTNASAQVRLWKISDAPIQPVHIRFLPHGKPDAEALTPLEVEEGIYQFSNYVEVPPGPFVAEISAPGHPAVLLPLYLADGGQSTLLVRLQGASLSAEWMDDLPGPADNGCELSVYNLLLASGEIQLTLGTLLNVRLSSTRSSLRLTGFKRANYTVATDGTDGNGKPFHWNTDADFRQVRKAALLIYPDAYGRIRPRIVA